MTGTNQTPFADRLLAAVESRGSPCVVGLDPSLDRMPRSFFAARGLPDGVTAGTTAAERADLLFAYNDLVLSQVHDLVAAVKPQSAYFERYGSAGIAALERTIGRARELGLLVILDVKRGDIDATSEAYARAYLTDDPASPLASDCVTLSPYLGEDSLAPFFEACLRHGTGAFVCVKTSNPGAAALQDLRSDGRALYEAVADLIKPWSERSRGARGYASIGAVVGATYPDEARGLRDRLPHSMFLVPGFGAQGGGGEGVRACFNPDGLGAVVNSSRAIMYPHLYSRTDEPLPDAIRRAATRFVGQVRDCLAGRG